MKTILIAITLMLMPLGVYAQTCSNVYYFLDSALTPAQRNTASTYGYTDKKAVKYRNVYITQVLRAPNTYYWSVIIATTTNVQNTFILNLVSGGKLFEYQKFTYVVNPDGTSYIRTDYTGSLPADFYKVWQSSN